MSNAADAFYNRTADALIVLGATLFVFAEMLGAFAAGLVAGFAMTGDARRLIATGLLGGFTTFSTWMLQTDRLAAQRHRRLAIANVVAAGALGLVAVWLGRRIGLALDA